ncbi:coxI translation protein CYA5, partial [Rhypophila sp. PSN 637]
MLERTAASIEPCGFRRVLPCSSSKYSLNGQRRLHTSFWQNAAPDIELLDACSALMRMSTPASLGAVIPTKSDNKFEPSLASTFVLDFLYPNWAAPSLRRFRATLSTLQPFSGEQKARALTTRLYTSSSGHKSADSAPSKTPDSPSLQTEVPAPQTDISDASEPQLDRSSKFDHRVLSGPDGLRQLLTSQDVDTRPYENVWTLYSGLDDAQKEEFRTDVTLYLSRSTRPVEAWRVCELFSLYSIEEWTDDLVEAAVRARLMFQDLTTAQAIFTTALEKRQLGKALDPFVVYCFRTENWQLFFDAWALFEEHMPRFAGSPYSRTFIFRALAAFPDFETNFKKLWDYAVKGDRQARQQDKEERLKHMVRSFLKRVAARSLPFFSPKDATVMVQYTKDKMAYEAFIHLCVERGWVKLAMEAYKNYRELSGRWIRGSVLQAMVHVFYQQKDTVGMQQLLEDWTSGTWRIGLKAYQKFIAFYARLGDVATVQRLVKDYLKQHKFAKMDPSVLSALIQVHCAAGDCDAARRVLEEYVATSAVPPNTVHWNNLIQAYVKARDFEGAMSAFKRLCEENQPDQHSFGIVMGMAGSRGDLRLTLDLLRLSGELGVRPNTAMMDTLVEAYCQNDRFEEAALLCARTAKDADIEGSRTGLWNTLLHHHAKRRDLSSVNRILEYMTKHGVPYDEHTYGSLLQALVNCKQVHHAVHFLRVALRDGVFQPTDSHYVLIMSGFLRTGESYLALKTNELIKNKFPDTTNRMTAIIRALGNAKITLHSAPLRLGNDKLQYVNRALWLFRNSFGQESSPRKGNHRAAAEQYSQIILMLIQMRDFASVQEILSLYSLQFPARASEETMPIKLMLDMMLADFYEKKYDRVKEVFNIILTRMERAGKQSSALSSSAEDQDSSAQPPAGQLAPAFRYELCDALKTMQRLFQETDDAQGLIDMVEDVQRRGFKLDSKNWNIYVQALARMNRWQEAFMACEKELMPAWFGWPHVRAWTPDTKRYLPLELRRLTSYPRVARPITYTMLVLIRVWMDLDKLTLWSSEAERMMQRIKDTCPRAVLAV